jgi:hypothetical protein
MPNTSFSNSEKAQCVIWYAEGYRETAIQRKFRTKYRKTPPSRGAIRLWRQDYQQRGTHAHRGGNGRPQLSEEKKATIKSMFSDNPRLSLRQAESQIQVPKSTLWDFLRKELHLYPYKLQMGMALSDEDKQNRITFAHYIRSEFSNNNDYDSRLIFSDECSFSLSGGVNKQNCRIWGSERPQEVYESPQSAPSIMVWCAISKKGIIGPYFYENENVTGETYKKMLRYYFFPKLRDYSSDVIFQQDGAAPHFAVIVRQYLNYKLPGRWMGRGGPISWPARSPDLTPCDFFLWGYIKDYVFSELPTSIVELKTKIRAAISSIDENTLEKVFKNFKFRLDFLLRQNGGHFENLLN